MGHKAGFVNLIGYPNAGKSTLMNQLTGERLSIITPKAQTTRHRILGIVNGEGYQIVYSDTPGILRPQYRLQASMMRAVETALQDADIFLYLTEPDGSGLDEEVILKIKNSGKPLILLANKSDLTKDTAPALELLKSKAPFAEAMSISALHGANLGLLREKIIALLPEHEAYFPKDDELSDRPMRFFVSEMIREKIFDQFRQELPYASEVVVDSYQEKPDITAISATIYVERESQKAILLGHKGAAIKRLGTSARYAIESFIGTRVYLELSIKVSTDWRENPNQLKRFGYEF